MAERDQPGVEYIDLETKRGTVKTLSIRLYAPDGSIFTMPHGGSVMTYLSKDPPYKTKPDDEWRVANEKYEAEKAESLKLSNFQREVKNRQKELEVKKKRAAEFEEMKRMEAELAEAEAKLSQVETPSDTPKPKPKAKAKAVAND